MATSRKDSFVVTVGGNPLVYFRVLPKTKMSRVSNSGHILTYIHTQGTTII
jgi:hypothetical protein